MNDSAQTPIALRPAAAGDCDLVWQLNNEPGARRVSIRTDPIPIEEHRAWFATRLGDPHSTLSILEVRCEGVGVVRLDFGVGSGEAVISIAIAPPWRGRGVGSRAIRMATAAVGRRPDVAAVVALIRPENAASQRAFAAAGYVRVGETEAEGVSMLRYRWSIPTSVLLLCDGGAALGWGHAVRSAALAASFREAGFGSRLLLGGSDADLVRHLETSGQTVDVVAEDGWDAEAVAAAVRSSGARMLVVDSYRVDRGLLDAVHRATAVPRILIDDLADRDLRCEAVINPNPGAGDLDVRGFGAKTVLLGPGYALLRPGFAPGRRPRRRVDPRHPRVLVTLGGGALGARAVELAQALDGLDRPLSLDLLVGSGASDVGLTLARSAQHEVAVHVGRRDVEQILAGTTMAVSAAGTTCFELAACGVPALLVVAADNQRRGAVSWNDLGAFESLGELEEISPRTVAARVDALLDDTDRLDAMSRKGTELVRGDGARRTADALIEAFALVS